MNLEQRRSPFTTTQFELTDHLRIRERSLFRTVEVEVDLRRVSPAPLRLREAPVRWVVAAAVLTLLAIFAAADGWLTKEAGTTAGFLLVAGCAVACWFNAWQLYRNVLVYRDRVTQQTAFVLLRSSPSMKAVDDFCAQIAAKIDGPLPPAGASRPEIAAHNARILNYLLDAGVLLPEEHRVILSRLEQTLPKGAVLALVQRDG